MEPPSNSSLVTLGMTSMSLTSMTWVMNAGMSSYLLSTRMTSRLISRVIFSRKSCSSNRIFASSPMNGLSIISTLGFVSKVFISWNLRNSPLDRVTMYLSSSESSPNVSYSSLRKPSRCSGMPSSSSPTVGMSSSIVWRFQRCCR